MWSHHEEGPGYFLISKKLLSFQIATFDIDVGKFGKHGAFEAVLSNEIILMFDLSVIGGICSKRKSTLS